MSASLVAGSLVMTANMQFSLTNTDADGSVQTDPYQNNSYGLLPPDAALFYHGQYTIAISSTLSIDLKNLLDKFGGAIAFSLVYGFMIQNYNTTSGQFVNVGNSNFNTWIAGTAPTVKVGPKGALWLASNIDGYAVVASTGNVLGIQNPSATTAVVVRVTVIGK